jgi:3-oxoacyl-[acyl-carrier protein] reductase
MISLPRTVLVFSCPTSALNPKPVFAAVTTTNAAITALAKAFAKQGIKDQVQVNSIVPGAVMTETFLPREVGIHSRHKSGEAMKKFPEETGIRRYGQPEELCDLFRFMVTTPASPTNKTG